jgi:hypothetical protein
VRPRLAPHNNVPARHAAHEPACRSKPRPSQPAGRADMPDALRRASRHLNSSPACPGAQASAISSTAPMARAEGVARPRDQIRETARPPRYIAALQARDTPERRREGADGVCGAQTRGLASDRSRPGARLGGRPPARLYLGRAVETRPCWPLRPPLLQTAKVAWRPCKLGILLLRSQTLEWGLVSGLPQSRWPWHWIFVG